MIVLVAVTFISCGMPGGAPTAIALGVIALPILFQLGVPTKIAGPLFMCAAGAGWFISPAVVIPYTIFFGGPEANPYSVVFPYLSIGLVIYLIVILVFATIYLSQVQVKGAVSAPAEPLVERRRVPWYAWVTPAWPVILLTFFRWPVIPSFLAAVFYGVLVTMRMRKSRSESLNLVQSTLFKGINDMAMIIALWITVGMLIQISSVPGPVLSGFQAIFEPILPILSNVWILAAMLAIIGPPLQIYRGPLEMVGSGAGFWAILYSTKVLNSRLLFMLALVGDKISGSMDPTSSGVLWTWTTHNITQKDFLKYALPIGYAQNAVNLFIITYLWTAGMFLH